MSVRGPCAGRGGGAGASDEVQSGAVRNVSVGVGGVGGCQSRASLFGGWGVGVSVLETMFFCPFICTAHPCSGYLDLNM